MTTVLALLGVKALYLLFAWLLSAIVAQDLSDLKGYGEKPGLATGLLLSAVGVVVWLIWPANRTSAWARRVKVVDIACAVAALVLLLSMFFNWYGGESFWTAVNTQLDDALWHVYLVLLPVAAMVCYAQLHARGREGAHRVVDRAAVGAAVLALLITLLQLVDRPDGTSLEIGFFVGLIASVATLALSVLAARADRTQAGPETAAAARAEQDAAAAG